MIPAKPTTLWAGVSLTFGTLGCLGAVALAALHETYSEIANRSAGVGGIWMGLHLLVVAVLVVVGAVCGLIACVRIGGGKFGGRWMALTGIGLSCLPLVATFVLLLLSNADFMRR